jgi:hypothetical protein
MLVALAATALLATNAASRANSSDLPRLLSGWRAWDDLAIAVGFFEQGEFPVAPYRIENRFRRKADDFVRFRESMLAATVARGLRPGRFWETLADPVGPEAEWSLSRRFDDPGRALALGLGFRLLGGVAPFLVPWLGVLALLPVLAWTAWELDRADALPAAVVFLAGLGCSAFVIDSLQLGYSAAAFHLAGIAVLVPLATYAVLGRAKVRGLLARSAAAAMLLAVFVQARNANVLVYPGFALAVALGARRAVPAGVLHRRRARIAGVVAVGLALLAAAHWSVEAAVDATVARTMERRQERGQPPTGHDLWITLWQGLGDFDRSKGHVFLDQAGEEAVRREGARERLSARSEAILRESVLRDIREDPGWYAGILVRRLWATLSLRKLWPWGPLDGRSFVPAHDPQEGVTDNYFQLTAQADWFVLGGHLVELPVLVLLIPTLMLVALAWGPGQESAAAARTRARQRLLVLSSVAVAALATPVAVTTASGIELQMIVVPYLLGAAFLVDAVHKRWRRAPERT